MRIEECKVGQIVNFGRHNGEKTRGKISKVNRTRCKVEQIGMRGVHKAHSSGTVWTVPPSLMALEGAEKETGK